MKKSLSILFIAILSAILSGCMISASPTNKATVIVDPAEKKLFQINVFPSNATYTWKLDDVVVQQGTSKSYSYSPIEHVVGKQTLVIEAKTLLGTDTYTWSIDTTLSVPSEQRVIDDYLGGEQHIQITTMKYDGMVILPQGLNVSPDTLSIKSGVAGVTPISKSLKSAVAGTTQNSSVGVFNTEMNTNATALMRVEDGNGEIYLMKLFPKSEDIREVNPVINTKSTAVSIIALQPGVITGVPDIDAIILELIKSLPETEALASQIDSEYSAGTFKVDGHFSNEILTKMGACFDALNKLKLDDVIPGTSGTKSLFAIPNIIMLDDSVEWDCADDDTPVFHDTNGIDTDGVCVNATFNSIGQPSSFSMHNKLGRWAVLGVEQPDGDLTALDWVSPRPFQLPSTSEILVAIGKLTYAGAKQVVYKIFNVHGNGDTFMDKLKEIIGSYFGLSSSQSTYVFASASEYSMAVVGAHLGVSYSQYQDEIYMSIYASTLTEILIPLFSIIVDVAHEDVNKDVKDSIREKACTDAWEQLLTQLPEAISDISESIAQDGTLKGTGKFLTDFVAGTLCSENGLRLAQCFLKNFIDVQKVRTYIIQDFLSIFSKSVLTPYIEAYDKSVELFNLASSSLMFIYVLTNDNVSCVDTYTVDLSHVPVANAGPDKYVTPGLTVTLDGSGSTDPANDISSYHWQQTGGPAVTLTNSDSAIAQFTASVSAGSVLNFELTVTDAGGLTSTDTCVVSVGCIMFNKTFGGTLWDDARAVQQTSDGGYILAGTTESYGAGGYDAWLIKTDAYGNKLWDKTFGGSSDDVAEDVHQTDDGGYILAGWNGAYWSHEDNVLLIKTDAEGNKVWEKTFRGGSLNAAYDVQQTNDGGYILAGYTSGPSVRDVWLIKTDANGNKVWDKTFGGERNDEARAVQQTSDGGYILAGHYWWPAGSGSLDAWLIKTDANGNKVWDKTFGGGDSEGANAVQQTSDGGYILAGYTYSYGAGNNDAWLIKTDANGNKVWDKTFGRSDSDQANAVQQTNDGGYILAGDTYSYGAGSYYDAWLIKTDANGNKVWDKTFGGSDNEIANAVQLTNDGGYILDGSSWDVWLIKTDAYGNAPAAPTP
jgi:hypothetical protein